MYAPVIKTAPAGMYDGLFVQDGYKKAPGSGYQGLNILKNEQGH